MKTINCFIPFSGKVQVTETIKGLRNCEYVKNIYLLSSEKSKEQIEGCEILDIPSLNASTTMKLLAAYSDADFTLLYTKHTTLELGYFALERMVHIAEDSQAGMVYADSYHVIDGEQKKAPVIDYQFGSLRDDFNFGSLLLFNAEALKDAAARMKTDFQFAGLYDLRLKLSQNIVSTH